MLMLQGGEYEGRKKKLIDDENLRLFLLDEAETILDDEATRWWLFSTRRKSSDAAQSKAVSLVIGSIGSHLSSLVTRRGGG